MAMSGMAQAINDHDIPKEKSLAEIPTEILIMIFREATLGSQVEVKLKDKSTFDFKYSSYINVTGVCRRFRNEAPEFFWQNTTLQGLDRLTLADLTPALDSNIRSRITFAADSPRRLSVCGGQTYPRPMAGFDEHVLYVPV